MGAGHIGMRQPILVVLSQQQVGHVVSKLPKPKHAHYASHVAKRCIPFTLGECTPSLHHKTTRSGRIKELVASCGEGTTSIQQQAMDGQGDALKSGGTRVEGGV